MTKLLLTLLAICGTASAEIQPEPIGRIQTLPDPYPPHWIIAADAAFFHMNDGKFIILDADSDDPAGRFKGMLNGTFIPVMAMAETRPEIYILESFRARGHRGERTDVMTIYDKSTVADIARITADEVAAVQSKTTAGSPNTAAAIRRELVDRHGGEWPE